MGSGAESVARSCSTSGGRIALWIGVDGARGNELWQFPFVARACSLVTRVPLTALGRFTHAAAERDEHTGGSGARPTEAHL